MNLGADRLAKSSKPCDGTALAKAGLGGTGAEIGGLLAGDEGKSKE